MIFSERSHQYAYFVGFVSKTKRGQIDAAYQRFSKAYGKEPAPSDVFDVCPFNDGFEQVIRSYHIYENTKQDDLGRFLQNQFNEFFHLAADFVTPCCGDGRAFYANSNEGQTIMQCDRCMETYTLTGALVTVEVINLMSKQGFVERFGNVVAEDWPYHRKLAGLT